MIALALEVGSSTTKMGFIGEAAPRLTTESLHLSSQQRAHHEEEDMFDRHREERIFGSSVNMWRNDVTASKILEEAWQGERQGKEREEKELRPLGFSLQKENFFRFLHELIREMRELKDRQNSMNEDSSEYSLLVNQPAYLKKHETLKFRQTVASLAFDQLRLWGIFFIKNSVSTTFSQGKSSAIVIDSGHHYTAISRVVDGYSEKTISLNFGGAVISHQLQRLLQNRGVLNNTNFCGQKKDRVFDSLCKYKELTSFKANFAVDSSSEIQEPQVTLELADKATITINRSEIIEPFTRFQQYKKTTEDYFPYNYTSLARTAIDLLEEENHSIHIDTIILTGGNMLFSDLADRIADQLNRLLTNRQLGAKKIIKSVHPLTSSWIGSSVAGHTEAFHNYWCTAAEYREHGISIVNKKCPP